ncbi:MAG: EF-P beta-lysylation protein EpmB [Gammaproteobacteria bacterium]|nr:EF-P beta-lysylation protein EpmB [Gammaproteobacteria bacterium]
MPKTVPISVSSIQPIPAGWQQQLSQAITDPLQLLKMLEIDSQHFPQCQEASHDFQLKIPRSYVEKIQPGNINDPLLLQVMATGFELEKIAGFKQDPVGDLAAMPIPGLLHKYQGRVLLVTTGACAIHCRYCFRRHFPYSNNSPGRDQWQDAMAYIEQRADITEVILSGGDPLILSDQKLAAVLDKLGNIPHLKRLRLHTRLPVVLPDRITDELIHILKTMPQKVCIVIHANHGNEIKSAECKALKALHKAGITLLNQSVLLKGINDDIQSQKELCETLYANGVLPYYLHLLDPVAGAAHFETSEQKAIQLMDQLRSLLPGYLIPRLVREKPGENSKTPVFGL